MQQKTKQNRGRHTKTQREKMETQGKRLYKINGSKENHLVLINQVHVNGFLIFCTNDFPLCCA